MFPTIHEGGVEWGRGHSTPPTISRSQGSNSVKFYTFWSGGDTCASGHYLEKGLLHMTSLVPTQTAVENALRQLFMVLMVLFQTPAVSMSTSPVTSLLRIAHDRRLHPLDHVADDAILEVGYGSRSQVVSHLHFFLHFSASSASEVSLRWYRLEVAMWQIVWACDEAGPDPNWES